MLKKILFILALTVLITACAPQAAAPTVAAADVQGTAVAAAWTMVASTQAAIPTFTPLPPTVTPSPTSLPTFTPAAAPTFLVPTLSQLVVPTAAIAPPISDPNNCLKPLNVPEAGPLKNLRLVNQNSSTTNISLNLYKPNAFGQCGSLSYVLASGATRTVPAPSGYWYAYAWVLEPASAASGSFIIGTGTSSGATLIIEKSTIKYIE